MISVCVPSYASFERLTKLFLPSFIEHMSSGAKLYLLAQNYSTTEKKIIRAITKNIAQIKFTPEYPLPISMFKIRHDNHKMTHDDISLWADDDFIFKGNCLKKYQQGLRWMQIHPQCGAFRWGGYLGAHPQYNQGKVKFHGDFGTYRGIMIRKTFQKNQSCFTLQTMKLIGPREDRVVLMLLLNSGYYIMDVKQCDTLHKKDPLFTSMGDYDSVSKDHTGEGSQGVNAIPFISSPRNPANWKSGQEFLAEITHGLWNHDKSLQFNKALIARNYAKAKELWGSSEAEVFGSSLIDLGAL